ncbi:MAG: hypothetical protein R2764_25720, partial [Bacteroidales bacterium]
YKTNIPKKWLFLDDDLSAIEDFKTISWFQSTELKIFSSPNELIEKLIIIRNDKNDNLINYGLLMDIVLYGHAYIHSPPDWTGKEEDEYYKTNNGNDAGICFIENILLNGTNIKLDLDKEPYWNPPPPIIFVTLMDNEPDGIKRRIKDIKYKWASYSSCKPREAKVGYIRKWDASSEVFNKLFINWGIKV